MKRIAVDTNAAVDHIRPDRPTPPHIEDAHVHLPLPVLGELLAGAFSSRFQRENLETVTRFQSRTTVLMPTLDTAQVYGQLRAKARGASHASKLNDLWIAALCIQHDLPLLTNDGGFDTVPGLTVIHW